MTAAEDVLDQVADLVGGYLLCETELSSCRAWAGPGSQQKIGAHHLAVAGVLSTLDDVDDALPVGWARVTDVQVAGDVL